MEVGKIYRFTKIKCNRIIYVIRLKKSLLSSTNLINCVLMYGQGARKTAKGPHTA